MAMSYGLVGLLCFALMAAAASATTQFRVGGSKGWSVPDAGAEPFNAWAGRMRFQIGDQLLFVYPKETDSVLVVDQGAYNACNTTTYITKLEGGNTVFTFDRSGPFFFISGNQASCTTNQKLTVVVLAASHTPPGLAPNPPSSMPPTSAAPLPSPPSMTPPPAAPMPSPSSPPSPPSMTPPPAAPMPSPSSPPSPPSMAPPSGTPMPSPMAPPSAAPTPSPESAPSPTGSAPGAAPAATPGSPPSSSPGTPDAPGSPGTPGPGGAPQPPSDSTPPGSNSTTPGSGAAHVTAGLISTIAAGFGYAMLAI